MKKRIIPHPAKAVRCPGQDVRTPEPCAKKRGSPEFQILDSLSEADGRDLAALVSLLDPDARFDAAAVEAAINCGNAVVFVKRMRGHAAAMATVARFATPSGMHHRIEDVIVHPRLRGKGIGRKMISHVISHLRSLHAGSVELTSRPERVAANALYRSLGFTRRETNVYRLAFD